MDSTRIDEMIARYERLLHEESTPWDAPLSQAEELTGVGRLKLILAVLCALSFCLTLGHGSTAVSLVLCHAYPVCATVALTETSAAVTAATTAGGPRARSDAVCKWFTFWVLSAALLFVENHMRFVLCAVPCYALVKTVFLTWCSAPIEHNGCAYLRAKVLRRYLGPAADAAWWREDVWDDEHVDDDDDDDDETTAAAPAVDHADAVAADAVAAEVYAAAAEVYAATAEDDAAAAKDHAAADDDGTVTVDATDITPTDTDTTAAAATADTVTPAATATDTVTPVKATDTDTTAAADANTTVAADTTAAKAGAADIGTVGTGDSVPADTPLP